jgi:hypothetical protein
MRLEDAIYAHLSSKKRRSSPPFAAMLRMCAEWKASLPNEPSPYLGDRASDGASVDFGKGY